MQVIPIKGQQTAAKTQWNNQEVEAKRYIAFKAASQT
jgi:hypothetical protein